MEGEDDGAKLPTESMQSQPKNIEKKEQEHEINTKAPTTVIGVCHRAYSKML
jgi:hypothetical protein